MITEFTKEELHAIANEREQWAIAAHEKDLHGSAREWDLTAKLARLLADCKELHHQHA